MRIDKLKLIKQEGPLLAVPIFLSLLLNLHQPLLKLQAGLDPSFNYAINKATLLHKSFGNNFIATYGPLGHLVSDYIPNFTLQASIWLFISTLLLGLGSYLLLKKLFQNEILRYILSALLVYASSIGYILNPEWNYLVIFLLYCVLYSLAQRQKREVLTALTLIASTFLFIKFTLGLAAFGTILLLPLTRIKSQKNANLFQLLTYDYLTIIGSYAIFSYSLSRSLHINSLLTYIKSGWVVSANFSQAMSYQQGGTFIATAACAFILITILLLAIMPQKFNSKSLLTQVTKYAFIFPAVLVIWKYAVARQDAHIIHLSQISLPLVLIFYFIRIKRANMYTKAILTAIVLIVIALTAISAPLNKMVFSKDFISFIKQPIDNITQGKFITFWEMTQEKNQWYRYIATSLAADKLPTDYKAEIGKSGVDIYPWETAIIEANHLNWDNRPSPFSFESYSPYFDDMNANFFDSNRAPEYIIWSKYSGIYSIDARNVLWDEPKTLRTIMRTYRPDKNNSEYILLKKRSLALRALTNTVNNSQVARWGEWVNVPNIKSDLFLAAKYKKGKHLLLEEELLRAESVSISLRYYNGTEYSYRFIPENLGQGFLINKLAIDWDGLIKLFDGFELGRITAIRFNANPNYVRHVSSLTLNWFAESD